MAIEILTSDYDRKSGMLTLARARKGRQPKGSKYRNLTVEGRVIYYKPMIQGRRIKVSAKTDVMG